MSTESELGRSLLNMKKHLHDFYMQQFSTALGMQESWMIYGNRMFNSAGVLLEQLWESRTIFDEMMAIPRPKGQGLELDGEGMAISDLAHNEGIILLLLAYGIENYLKGLYFSSNGNDYSDTKKLPEEAKEHDLVVLCEMTGIQLSAHEKNTLELMTEYTVWKSKYPIPLKASQYANSAEPKVSLRFLTAKYPGDVDWPDEIISIVDKIKSRMNIK